MAKTNNETIDYSVSDIINRTKLNVRTSTTCDIFIKPFNQQCTWQLEDKEHLTVLNDFNIRCFEEFHEESINCIKYSMLLGNLR